MALAAFAGALLALSPTLAAFTATVGASATLTAGASPIRPQTPTVPFAQLSLAPIADVLYEGRKTVLQASYSPSLMWMPLALQSQGNLFLAHEGSLAYTHRTTQRLESTVTVRGGGGTISQFQLRNPNSLANGATQGGTGPLDTISLSGAANTRYLISRRWTYSGTLSGQLFEAESDSPDQTASLAPQRSLSTQQTIDYALTSTATLGANVNVGVTRNGNQDLLSSAVQLAHRRELGVVSDLSLAFGVANFSALPGSVVNPGQERTSGTVSIIFASEAGIGARRARYDISALWAPGVDVVLGQTRDRLRLAFTSTLPLDTNLSAGISVLASTATDSAPFSSEGQNLAPGQTQAGPIDETLLFISLPFSYNVNEEWTLSWGGTASWTAPHWRLPFELNNPYYAAFVGVGFRLPLHQSR